MKPTRTLFDAARNPALIRHPKRAFRVKHMSYRDELLLQRTYLRLDTAVPAALRIAINHASPGDRFILMHAEFEFEVARIFVGSDEINLVWDAHLMSFTPPKK